MKIKKIKIPIYFGSLTMIYTEDFKPLEKKYGLTPTDKFGAFCFREDGDYDSYVVVFGKQCDPGAIAHESLHLVNYIFNGIHANGDEGSDEPKCYLLGWVVRELHKFLETNKK